MLFIGTSTDDENAWTPIFDEPMPVPTYDDVDHEI